MTKKPLLRIVAALVALGLVGAGTYTFFWDPDPTYEAAPDTATAQADPAALARAADMRIFFGHMSVGNDIISGMRHVYDAHGVSGPGFLEAGIGEVPTLGEGGAFVHTLIGENRHPYRKLENFAAMLRGGLAGQVDVALIKFCYIDIRWDTDVDRLFETYRDTMAELEAEFPEVRFIHVTAPLTTGPYGIKDHVKQVIGRNDNANRERYNELMRAEYGPEQLLDVAALESRAPDGTVVPELYSGYSNDGAHLNGTGSALAALEFVRVLDLTRG